ncbi:MAG TPA: hypothetical protein VFO60_01280 [Candidatus Dormibacteraeota bacterium]|nr:hypothetical protein [Candidatus Dormibacteraeota bacterium]
MPLSDRLDAIVDHKLTHVEDALSAKRAGPAPAPAPPAAPRPPAFDERERPGTAEVGGSPVEVEAPAGTGRVGEGAPPARPVTPPPPRSVAPRPPAAPPPAPPAAAAPTGDRASTPPPPATAPAPGARGTAPSGGASGAAPQALEVLIRFIPVGVTSAYVAAAAPIGEDQYRAHLYLLLFFAALTGVTAWVGFAVRLRRRVLVPVGTLLGKLRIWPKWQIFAGTLAFVSWGVAIHPAAMQAIAPGLAAQVARTAAAIGVVIVGFMLSTFDELVV